MSQEWILSLLCSADTSWLASPSYPTQPTSLSFTPVCSIHNGFLSHVQMCLAPPFPRVFPHTVFSAQNTRPLHVFPHPLLLRLWLSSFQIACGLIKKKYQAIYVTITCYFYEIVLLPAHILLVCPEEVCEKLSHPGTFPGWLGEPSSCFCGLWSNFTLLISIKASWEIFLY